MSDDVLLADVVQQRDLNEVEARALVDGIRRDGMDVVERTAVAYKGRAWIALGYPSWDAMREAEFADPRLGIPREERAEQVLSLRAAGMSTREIGKALGVDKDTVGRDLARVPNGDTSPTTITDSLGRQQPANKPPRPQASPPTSDAGVKLAQASEAEGGANLAQPSANLAERSLAASSIPDLTGVNLTAEQYQAKVTALGETEPVEQWQEQPQPNPLAAARSSVAKQPAMAAGTAIDYLRRARMALDVAGTPAEVLADLINDELPDGDRGHQWLRELDAALPILTDLASALRRRNLRSVQP